jgi:serine/threonine protein kinase
MSQPPDLVSDSKLPTSFRNSITVHSYPEIDEAGRRFSREAHWKQERLLGYGGFGQVWLEQCIIGRTKQDSLRAVKIINKPQQLSGSKDFNRELEALAKFSNRRVWQPP